MFIRQMVFFAALLTVAAVANTFTAVADYDRLGTPLPLWQPAVWEFSSNLMIWVLVPLAACWLAAFPLSRANLWRSLPAHLVVTAPFSLLHTAGMVLLRKCAYGLVGERYDFGPFVSNWIYEYRKDALTYCVIVGALLAFRTYGLWLDTRSRRDPEAELAAAGAESAGSPGSAASPVRPVPPASPGSAEAFGPAPTTALPLGRLLVRKRNREFILDVGEIDRIEADGNYVVVHASGETYRLRDSLEGLTQRLGNQRFARVHRAHVVNIDRIREIQPWDHGDYRIVLKDGSFVNLSRRYRGRLQHLFH